MSQQDTLLPDEEHRQVDRKDGIYLNREEILRRDHSYWILRRAQDVFFSLIALIVLLIPMLIIALVVVIDDPHGGPFFSQTRVGRDGKEFQLYKFRSMVVNAEEMLPDLLDQNEMEGPTFKMRDDPRITRVGRFLRRSALDELPQLLNVLKGDMSIVGPRPPLPREVEQYSDYERQRLIITPGLTCYWQVRPNRNDMSFEEWLKLDLRYIQERNVRLDWKIIFKTFGAMVRRQGR